jgi:hypothetical protein
MYEMTFEIHGRPLTVPCAPSHQFSIDVRADWGMSTVHLRHGEHHGLLPIDDTSKSQVDIWDWVVRKVREWVDDVHRDDVLQSDWPVF